MEYDTIVIGAGLAGLTAANARAARGERVLLLAKGHGACQWASGCVDLLDAPEHPLAAIAQLAAKHPLHPYARVGPAALHGGLKLLQSACSKMGYPLVGSPTQTLRLPTALGALRPTSLVPLTMVAGEARQLAAGGPLLIAGFRALRDFFPPLIAANLRTQGFPATSCYLTMPNSERQRDFTPMNLAHLFERPAFRENVAQQLRAHVRQGGYTRIGLPAVLGLHHAVTVVQALQQTSNALIFEIPTPPTSIPGMRLAHALEQAARQAGVHIQLGSWVVRGSGSQKRLETIYSAAAAREQRHHAQHWVLATGGILGGGIRREPQGALRETALGLPVHSPSQANEWFHPHLFAPGGHPIFQAGIATDQHLRPLDAAGQIMYTNVMIVGSALAHCDPLREGCREGIAVATGYKES
ncbi:MAG: glycerol-3-phosphate dehydrogenase subunit GlpB [Candidatus Viridilinea halotolerans]|uniref:Glycerol-3-phosphate dehydrogenase subunit GlpB n=1 Tax=Candidatus Viridilinea halotolerans TaxID=2491704 RepID=A0A426TSN8_9CHLR|nr:MAG: glycerol-3-phosphate dehydrogenase subunit GlpB [Candidatus Viridilinea halotolerans]